MRRAFEHDPNGFDQVPPTEEIERLEEMVGLGIVTGAGIESQNGVTPGPEKMLQPQNQQ